MSASSLQAMARINTRSIKKLEKPRPLKLSTSLGRHATSENRLSSGSFSVDEVMALADSVCQHIVNGNFDRSLQPNILALSSNLKVYGQQLEAIYKDQLDRLFVAFRNGSKDERLDYVSRLHLLELVELRGANWAGCDNMFDYYRHKIAHSYSHEPMELLESPVTPTSALSGLGQLGQFAQLGMLSSSSPTTPQPTLLNPGEILKTSGKFPKPTKIPNKNYCKDEVVIRNSDSGKVNPGAKERLVQITGPSEEKIIHARHLMEDTIRRNASPVRPEVPEGARDQREALGGSSSSLNSSASDDSTHLSHGGARRSTLLHSFSTNDANLGEYKYTVAVGSSVLKITGSNHDLVRAAKLVLDEYFAGQDQSYLDSYEEELPSPPACSATVSVSASASEAVKPLSRPHTPVNSQTVPVVPAVLSLTPPLAASTPETVVPNGPISTSSAAESSSLESSASGSDETVRAFAPVSSGATAKRRQYSLDAILSLASCPASMEAPLDWIRITKEFPSIVRKVVTEVYPCGYAGDYVNNYSRDYCYEYDYVVPYMGTYAPSGYVTGYMGDLHGACAMKWHANAWDARHRRLSRRIVPPFWFN